MVGSVEIVMKEIKCTQRKERHKLKFSLKVFCEESSLYESLMSCLSGSLFWPSHNKTCRARLSQISVPAGAYSSIPLGGLHDEAVTAGGLPV